MPDSTRPETILVVEDAVPVRKMVCGMLRTGGYKTLEAGDGLKALQLLEGPHEDVDLVLTDVVMPEMNGMELARELSRRMPQLRLMFMSGFMDEPLGREVDLSAITMLRKPFTSDVLLAKVREALDSPWHGLREKTGK